CVFCDRQQGKPSVKNLVLFKGKKSFIILNRYPYTNGHLMVIPYRHISDYTQLTQEEHKEMGMLKSKAVAALKKVYNPEGFNIGMNLGDAGGAGIKDHLHYHIVPRWLGDSNYMSVVSETRVIMDSLENTYRKIKKAL
ncbi:HIT domain-containing protein, partial [bacterium]|nr:HIT domain-containing protein [bacterium]